MRTTFINTPKPRSTSNSETSTNASATRHAHIFRDGNGKTCLVAESSRACRADINVKRRTSLEDGRGHARDDLRGKRGSCGCALPSFRTSSQSKPNFSWNLSSCTHVCGCADVPERIARRVAMEEAHRSKWTDGGPAEVTCASERPRNSSLERCGE